jgi:hypothetical protein
MSKQRLGTRFVWRLPRFRRAVLLEALDPQLIFAGLSKGETESTLLVFVPDRRRYLFALPYSHLVYLFCLD